MKRVLFYYAGFSSDTHYHGGTSQSCLSIAQELSKDMDAFEVTLSGDFVFESSKRDQLLFSELPRESGELERFLRYFDVVIFATHLGVFATVSKPCNQSWILDSHCWDIEASEKNRLSDFDLIFARSEIHADWLRSSMPLNIVNISPVGSPFNSEIFRETEEARLRNRYRLIFVGATVPHKGLHILIGAFLLLREMFPQLSLEIFGSSALWRADDSYEQSLRNLNIAGVRFHGSQPQNVIAQWLNKSSILCLPSIMESFGLCLVEAQACGCIPVARDVGGVSATVLNGQTGILYDGDNAHSLAQAIYLALDAQDLIRKDLSLFVQNNFSPSIVAARVKREINYMTKKNSHRSGVFENSENFPVPRV